MYKIQYVGPQSEVELPSVNMKFARGIAVEVSDEVAAMFQYGTGMWSYVTEWYEKPDETAVPEYVEGGAIETEGASSADMNKEV